MVKTSISNHAISSYYRKQVNACWHDKVTCTVNSTSKQIQSDVIAAAYDFLTTDEYDSTNLLQALKIAKNSKHRFEHDIISCDEFIEALHPKALLRLLIKFSPTKEKIKVKCFIQRKSKPLYSLTRDSMFADDNFRKLQRAIIELENDYDEL